jgi:formylglycine-generating enzyme required for sulfatase activity
MSIPLASEAQWENACRAGANTKFFWGDDERKLGDYCWYRENMGGRMRAVGLKKPNAFGLYDINGLMWETCRKSDTDASPRQDDSANNYILRGATFGSTSRSPPARIALLARAWTAAGCGS